ncbi:MAG: GAF domain-containing protein [Chloroflexi bacterium]|nr:GAF domain-containing protein [Chloroflexota bacterium]
MGSDRNSQLFRKASGFADQWVWYGLWVLGILLAIGFLALYAWLPADGATGDLESFDPAGFRVQWLLEAREGGLQVGDLIVRAGAHTVDEWLDGAPRGPEWRTGGVVAYEIQREGQSLTLPIRLAPVPFSAILMRWMPQLIVALSFFAIGTFVFWKRPHELTARLLMLICVTTMLQHLGDGFNFQYAILPWRWPFWFHFALEHITFSVTYASICYFALVFPAPHPWLKRFPRLIPLVVYASFYVAIAAVMALSPTWSMALEISNRAVVAVAIAQITLVVYLVFRSVRHARDPVTRAQMRWILWMGGLTLVVVLPGYLLPLMLTGRPPISPAAVTLITVMIPLTFGIVILRYRLWDIDIIINRTLVYGTLTAIMLGVYLLMVPLLTLAVQVVLQWQNDTLAVFIAALGLALAFAPLRRRVQAVIDRAFYRTKLDYQRLLPELSEKLSTSVDLDQLAVLLTRELPDRLQIASGILAVLDPDGQWFVVAGRRNEHPNLPTDHPLAEHLRRRGRPLLRLQIPDHLPATAQAFLERYGIELVIPLVVGAELVGLYNLGPKLSGDVYNRDEIRLLYLLGRQAAVAVENGRLFQAEREQRALSETLREVASALNSSLDREHVLQLILEQLARVVAYDSASVMLVADVASDTADDLALDNLTLDIVAQRGFRSDEQILTPLRVVALRHIQEVLERQRPVMIPDTSADARWQRAPGSEYIRCWLGVPLVAPRKNRAIGLLNLDNEQPGFYTDRDAQIALAFADQSAIAIANAQLFTETQIAYEQLKRTQAQLVQAAKMAAIGQLAAGVAHEINNPLTGILGFAQLLSRKDLGSDTLVEEGLSVIAKEAVRARDIVRGLLDFARQSEFQRQPADINQVIQETLALVRQQLEHNHIVVTESYATGLPLMSLDVSRMKQVFLNLINNAIQAMPQGGTLGVSIMRVEDEVQIRVADTGVGIPDRHLSHIFEPFFTTKPVGQGTGLGLSVSLGILQDHGGRIEVESEEGQGSTFTVWLPME